MPTTHLPSHPSLENLRKQAKALHQALLQEAAAEEAEEGEELRVAHDAAVALLVEFHPRGGVALGDLSLSDAQLVIARRYGFESWPKLKKHVETLQEFSRSPHAEPDEPPHDAAGFADAFVRLACLTYGGDHLSRRERARQLLVEHPEIRDDFCVQVAIGDAEAVGKRLGESPDLARTLLGPHRWEPLLYACYSRIDDVVSWPPQYSTLQVARLLLAHGADPNAGYLWDGIYPFTALTGAFGEGESGPTQQPPHKHCEALARMLLEAGADPNDSQTLYNRMFSRHDDHLRLLLAFGLGKDQHGPWSERAADQHGSPARLLIEQLWYAAGKNYFDRVELLVEHGAPVDAAGVRDGRTIYETALRSGNREIADYLVQHGARRIEPTPEQAFESACVGGDGVQARALLAKNPRLLASLGERGCAGLLARAVGAGKLEGVRLMAELGFDLDGMTRNTALHEAAWQGDLAMVRLLVELGAATDIREPSFNATALSWGNHSGQKEVTEFLLQHADVFDAVQFDRLERLQSLLRDDPTLANARDRLDQTPLHFLRAGATQGPAIIRALLAAGADPEARDREGRTAREKLQALGREDLADELRR